MVNYYDDPDTLHTQSIPTNTITDIKSTISHPTVSTTYREGFFTSNAKAIHLDDVECLGTESNLLHCGYDYRTIDCSHAKDAGVQCYQSGEGGGGRGWTEQ